MSDAPQGGVVLDAGAFIALENRRPRVKRLIEDLVADGIALVTSGGVVAQIWRGGAGKQAPVAMLLRQVHVVPLDEEEAKAVGMILGMRGTSDPVDAHVVLLARERGWPILTSDEDDLRALDPRADLIRV